MASASAFGRMAPIAAYVMLSLAVVLLAILPLDRLPGALPGPDLLLAITVVWVVRKPDAAPVLAIAGVFLLADLFWMRPPGLMAAAVVVGTEFLRRQSDLTTEVSFVAEWSVVAAIVSAIMIGQASVLVLLGVTVPTLGTLLIKLVGTILAYPVVAGLARPIFGVRRKGAQAELGFGGQR